MDESGLMREQEVGEVTHYWTALGVAGVHLDKPVDVGDKIHILGHTSDFEQTVGSMELDHHRITHADAGIDIGIQVSEHAREHDKVYRLLDTAEMAEGETEL